MPASCILSLGYDDVLVPLRSLLLRQAGYHVIETCSLGEALRRVKTGGIDLFLICHTVPSDQREAILDDICLSQPELRFLCLAAERVYCGPEHYDSMPRLLSDVTDALAKPPGS